MSDLSEFRALASEQLGEFGTTSTLIVPNGVLDDAGTVVESPVEYPIVCSDIVDESRRYSTVATSQVIVGTIYVDPTVAVDPALGHRVSYQGRQFAVVGVFPYRLQGGVVAWRLDLAEVVSG